jgi:hypothetical protein
MREGILLLDCRVNISDEGREGGIRLACVLVGDGGLTP